MELSCDRWHRNRRTRTRGCRFQRRATMTTPTPVPGPGPIPTQTPLAPPAAPVMQGGPPAAKPGMNGCLKAFLIGSGIAVVLGTLAVVGLFMIGKKAVDDFDKSFGVAATTDYETKI